LVLKKPQSPIKAVKKGTTEIEIHLDHPAQLFYLPETLAPVQRPDTRHQAVGQTDQGFSSIP
jgi:hypothetical protein